MPEVIVIGSGIIGLSSALELQAAGCEVRIVTREMPLDATSVAAGAVWSASDLDGRQRTCAELTLKRFLPLTQTPDSGVTLQRMREVFAEPMPEPWYRDQLPYFARMKKDDLPPGMADGYLLDVPIVAPPLYLRSLQAQFLAAGGTIEKRHVSTLRELADEATLLVNCSGVGARDLAQDENVYPIRGQTLLVDAPQIQNGYMDNSQVVHIFPRADGVLLGGIKRYHDWRRQVDPAITDSIVADCAKIEPSLQNAQALRHFAGLRPGRREARLEIEKIAPACQVIHNYGHGAIGYTLSWGCAADVLRLVGKVL
ncbi:MAG: FAD-dependent oxidoreductase [Chloroflexi bacterium]|nr:FAD-dependent oxidoreductase [Chloroflexota bacterium]